MTQLFVAIFLSLLLLNFVFSSSFNEYMWSGALLVVSTFIGYFILRSMFNELKLTNRLLEETQKNLILQKEMRKKITDLSGEAIRELERELKR